MTSAFVCSEYVNQRKSRHIEFTNEITVTHYADTSGRVSTDMEAKRRGLDTFYRKYWHRFDETQQGKSLKRAREYFGYELPDKQPAIPSTSFTGIDQSTGAPFNLHIGTISDSEEKVRELLKSFLELYKRDGQCISHYTFHILDNSNSDEYEIKPIVQTTFRQRRRACDIGCTS